jgi:hypothetical protein
MFRTTIYTHNLQDILLVYPNLTLYKNVQWGPIHNPRNKINAYKTESIP